MNVVLGNQPPLSISKSMAVPEKCHGASCVGRLRRSMISGACVLRCEEIVITGCSLSWLEMAR